MSAYLALYFGLFGFLYRFIRERVSIPYIILIPIVWVAIECFRSIGFWGFPAGVLGYSQYQNIYLIQIADIVGVLGISFLLVFVNAGIFFIILFPLISPSLIQIKNSYSQVLVYNK